MAGIGKLTRVLAMLSLLAMSTTLTIRNLDQSVKRKLRLRAALHQTSMEAEARNILAAGVEAVDGDKPEDQLIRDARRKRIEQAMGIWNTDMQGRSTDDIMKDLRGDD